VGNLAPIYWFAFINALTTLLTLGVTEVLRRRAGALDHRRAVLTIMAFNGVMVAGLIAFGLARQFPVAVAAYITLSVARGAFHPVFSAWINRGIDPKVRATVLSAVGQMDAFGQVAGGPPVGVLANRYGLRAAMVAVAVMLTPAIALLARALGQPAAAQTDVGSSIADG
jgi:DHA3 family tetracycline resistance protein-like MFS transporter